MRQFNIESMKVSVTVWDYKPQRHEAIVIHTATSSSVMGYIDTSIAIILLISFRDSAWHSIPPIL